MGESLLPCGGEIRVKLGLIDETKRRYIHKPGARFICGETGREQTYDFKDAISPRFPSAFQVSRADFDRLLLRNAESLGVTVVERATVHDEAFHPFGADVEVTFPHQPGYAVRSRFFVDATGRDTFLGTKLGLKIADPLVTTNVACFTHYDNAERQPGEDEGNITIVFFPGGWWRFIPFKGSMTSVGCTLQKEYTLPRRGPNPSELFEAALAETPVMQKFLASATRTRPVETTGNWS